MRLQIVDFMPPNVHFTERFSHQWNELEHVLFNMPLHLKASDQYGKQGSPIFDPVGTNEYIASALTPLGWGSKITIPPEFSFLGTDVDFGKRGLVAEIQFSNYPFLLNNTIRSQLFYAAGTIFHEIPTQAVVIVTKSGALPSSNSTLYFEQAAHQLGALAQNGIFTVPIRLVGLFEDFGQRTIIWSEYSASRYSRTILNRSYQIVNITAGRGGKCRIE